MDNDEELAAKLEHASRLRKALVRHPTVNRGVLEDATGRGYRTVSNWISETKPTMPSAREKEILRRLLGPYDSPGDQVEYAIRQSALIDWRQDAVVSFYKRNLAEQDEGRTA